MSEKPILFSTEMVRAILEGRKTQTRRVVKPQPVIEDGHGREIKCPWQPGDILWVRETWCKNPVSTGYPYCYKASEDSWIYDNMEGMWRPSIHMPREAARIFLRVKNVRVEKLQEIMPDDVLQEGLWDVGTETGALDSFAELWNNINAKRGYGWSVNPWIWVIEFEKQGGETE